MLAVELPKALDAPQLSRLALKAGLSIASGRICWKQQTYRNCMRLNLSHASIAQLRRGVSMILGLTSANAAPSGQT
jgi:DNA-binding transcriptional MocR family regulator